MCNCRLSNGEEVAFELVEICNPVNARFSGSASHIHGLIMSAYRSLPPSVRKAFDHRFINVPLSFSFRPTASLSAIRNALPSLLTELVSAPEDDVGYYGLSAAVKAVVLSVRRIGRVDNPGNVNFNIGTNFDPTVSLEAVAAKLSRQYKSDSPIELLAYFGGHAWAAGTHGSALTRRIEMCFHKLLKQLASARLGESGCSTGMRIAKVSSLTSQLPKKGVKQSIL